MPFPGNALIIDELFELAYQTPITDNPIHEVQQKSFIGLKNFLDNNGITFSAITTTSDASELKNRISSYSNIRLIILDLDLNDDGEVGEVDDYPVIFLILREAIKKFGYFFLLINSAHAEKWQDIKNNLPEDLRLFAAKGTPSDVYDKTSQVSIVEKLDVIKSRNYSLELLFDFESFLNEARDKAFQGLIDQEKRTWNKIYNQVQSEAGNYANYIICDMLFSLVKQHMLGASFTIPKVDDPIDESIAKRAFINATYILNRGNVLDNQPKWTGNLYYIQNPSIPHLHYALIVTPECDIAQNRFLHYQIICGYEVNDNTFPNTYDPAAFADTAPPLHALKNGRSKGKWKNKETLLNKSNFIEHLYLLPYASNNEKSIIFDFRDLTFVTQNRLDTFQLIKRVTDPVMTDILNKISGIYNRKGLPPILPLKLNPLV